MKIFSSIQLGSSGAGGSTSGQSCQNCACFQNDPAVIEAVYSGLTAMSSGYASVRDRDGFCNCHEIYLSARDSCAQFAAGAAEAVGPTEAAGTPGAAGL